MEEGFDGELQQTEFHLRTPCGIHACSRPRMNNATNAAVSFTRREEGRFRCRCAKRKDGAVTQEKEGKRG